MSIRHCQVCSFVNEWDKREIKSFGLKICQTIRKLRLLSKVIGKLVSFHFSPPTRKQKLHARDKIGACKMAKITRLSRLIFYPTTYLSRFPFSLVACFQQQYMYCSLVKKRLAGRQRSERSSSLGSFIPTLDSLLTILTPCAT